jgi:molecular chaperone DnaK
MTSKRTERYFGIDFGTTNTAVVSFNGRETEDVGDAAYAGRPFPSIVAIDNLTDTSTCGGAAKKLATTLQGEQSHTIIRSVKLALDSDEVWLGAGRQWTAEQAAAELLKVVAQSTVRHYDRPIERAVIAIPVNMSAASRAALRRAAHGAGIEVASFVSEPTAAFASNADTCAGFRHAAVFDWGGGTLDFSVIETRGGRIAEMATDGWRVAGDEIDRRIAEFIHERLCEREKISTPFDSVSPNDRRRMLDVAEECKIELQRADAEPFQVLLARYMGKPRHGISITGSEIDAILSPIVDEALDGLFRCIEKARIAPDEIGALVVVGGSSHLRILRHKLNLRWTWADPIFPEEAEWDIARGAAILAASPGADELSESIGLVLADDEYHPIFLSGQSIEEAEFERAFGLVEDTRSATFVFAKQHRVGSIPRYVREMHVPVLGFADEVIHLEATITNDLVFEARARSRNRPKEIALVTYEGLSWRYRLPEKEEARHA